MKLLVFLKTFYYLHFALIRKTILTVNDKVLLFPWSFVFPFETGCWVGILDSEGSILTGLTFSHPFCREKSCHVF